MEGVDHVHQQTQHPALIPSTSLSPSLSSSSTRVDYVFESDRDLFHHELPDGGYLPRHYKQTFFL